MFLTNKNALITGADGGIGKATLETFVREGANVWAFCKCKTSNFTDECKKLEEQYGVWIKPIYADLTNNDEIKQAFKLLMADKQPLHILVNNAGAMGEDRVFQMTSFEEMQNIFQINFFSMVEVSRLATRLMARNKTGAVVNIASIAGLDGDSRLDYSAAKGAVITATKKMARELVSLGIRVNAIAPGMTNTNLVASLSENIINKQLENVLMNRMGKPTEIAEVIAFLASDKASYVTGQVWRVDGGIL